MLCERDEGTSIARAAIRRAFSESKKIPMSEIIYKTRGKIKQVVGTLAGKDKLKADGEVELKGKAEGALEDIKHAAEGAAK